MAGLDVLAKMRALRTPLIIVWILTTVVSVNAEKLSKAKPIDSLRFGEKTASSMLIIVGGDVANPGKYHLPKGFGLKSLLGIVGGYAWNGHRSHGSPSSAQFSGAIQVFRTDENGVKRRMTYKISELQRAERKDVPLLKDDMVNFVSLRMYEE